MPGRMTITRTSAPVRAQAVRILQNAIVSGYFSPGQRLVERELCGLLGASRTTVREALRQLEVEGLVKVVPGKGVVAASVSPSEAVALYEVREALEGLAGRLFAECASDETVSKLEGVLHELEIAVAETPHDVKAILTVKDRFYEILFEGSGNPVLHTLAASVHARVTLLRSMSLSQPGRLPETLREVRRILEAIRRRDPVEGERACIDHVRRAGRVALGVLEKEGEGSRFEATAAAEIPTVPSA